MSTNYVFFVAVFLLFNIATRCAVGELIRRELDIPSCNETFWAKETLITNFQYTPEVCEYHLKAYSPRVRKLFIEFSTVMTPPMYKNCFLECIHDYLEIAGRRFCGILHNQRISFPLECTKSVEQITLRVRLASRSGPTANDVMPQQPNWIIRIQQLEETSDSELIKSELDTPNCGATFVGRETQFSYFGNPPAFCKFHLKAYSPRVRQLLFEFSTTLAPPTNYENGYLECVHDYLEIAGRRFCGTQQKQLLSLPFNADQGVREITLTVRLASRLGTTGMEIMPQKPKWTIMIHQLEEGSAAFNKTLVGSTTQ